MVSQDMAQIRSSTMDETKEASNLVEALAIMFHLGHISIAAARLGLPADEMENYIELISSMQIHMTLTLEATQEDINKAMKLSDEIVAKGNNDVDELFGGEAISRRIGIT